MLVCECLYLYTVALKLMGASQSGSEV